MGTKHRMDSFDGWSILFLLCAWVFFAAMFTHKCTTGKVERNKAILERINSAREINK